MLAKEFDRIPELLSGKPEAVQNCSVVNESTDSFTVNCAPGFNGGLPQQFRLGVYLVKPSDGARVLVANLTSAAPRFGFVFFTVLYCYNRFSQ